jgi:glutamate 5-kinase
MRKFEPSEIKRIVVKIGTTTITGAAGGVDESYLADIAGQVAELKGKGREAIIVSSGAIGLGVEELGLREMPREIVLRQACAAVGQNRLMNAYAAAFKRFNQTVAQILITYDSFSNRKVYLNLRNSLNRLLELGVVPIINENDAIAVEEIGLSFGDNDKLSALVAGKLDADLLVVLSDVAGLFEKNPKRHKGAKLIKTVERISREIELAAEKRGSPLARGGMSGKIEAAKVAVKSGCHMVIANGREKNVLTRLLSGERIGTLFLRQEGISSKEKWLSFAAVGGAVSVDAGAKKALLADKSLLAKGIVGIRGSFKPKDIVSIEFAGKEFARGRVDYSSEELKKIMGKHSSEIERAIGSGRGSVIKTENIIILSEEA